MNKMKTILRVVLIGILSYITIHFEAVIWVWLMIGAQNFCQNLRENSDSCYSVLVGGAYKSIIIIYPVLFAISFFLFWRYLKILK